MHAAGKCPIICRWQVVSTCTVSTSLTDLVDGKWKGAYRLKRVVVSVDVEVDMFYKIAVLLATVDL